MGFRISTMTLNYIIPQAKQSEAPSAVAPQQQITLEDLVKRIYQLKFDGIELAFGPPIVDVKRYGTAKGHRELKELLDSNGLEVSCLTGMLIDKNSLKDLATLALELETKKVGFQIPMFLKEQGKSHDEIVSEVKKYAKIAEDMDLMLVYEVHGNPRYNDKPHDILRLFHDIGSPFFKCQVDFMHIMRDCSGVLQSPPLDIIKGEWGKLPAIFIRMLGEYVGDVHADDAILNWTIGMGRTPFGKGFIDFEEAFKALKEVGYEDWLTLDIHTIPGDIWQNTIESKQFLEKMLHKLKFR